MDKFRGSHYSCLFVMSESQYDSGLSYLTAHELDVLASFKSEIRKREWAGSRLLAKYLQIVKKEKRLVHSWNVMNWTEIKAAADEHHFSSYEYIIPTYRSGPPTIKYGFDTVSISHKWPMLCLGLAEFEPEFGVDVEKVTTFDDDFCDYFFSYESDLFESLEFKEDYDVDCFFTMVWTVKEAYIKATKKSGLTMQGIHISFETIPKSIIGVNNDMEPMCLDEANVMIDGRTWHAEFIKRGDYIAAQLCPNKFSYKAAQSSERVIS